MSSLRLAVVGFLAASAVVSCGSNTTSSSGGADQTDAAAAPIATAVSAVTASVGVPADFSGDPVKLIFGWGDKQIVDANGKLLNAPQEFLPTLAGIPNPVIVPGQPYALDVEGLDIPFGDHYVLVAIYVKGTGGAIPEQGKDYVAGSLTTVSFTGAKVTLPAMTFEKAGGM